MPRSARKQSESGIYHVMLRGVNQQQIFAEKEDYQHFLEILSDCKKVCAFELFSYCLMGNHIHLLMKETKEPLETIFRRIGSRFVYWYNLKYQRVGHLFQDRYKSEAVENDAYFLTVLRYILQNPLKARLESQIGVYPWTSYRAYTGQADGLTDTDFAIGLIGDKEQLLRFIHQKNSDTALDIAPAIRNGITDEAALEIMKKVAGVTNPTAFQELEKARRDRYIQKLFSKKLSLRQISRLTGISKTTVERVVSQ